MSRGESLIVSDRTHRDVFKCVCVCAVVNVLRHVHVKLWEILWGQERLRNIRWLTEDGSPLWRVHTHSPDDITQVEDLPCALATLRYAAWMYHCVPDRVMWCVQQYQLDLSVSPFLKLEFPISHCWTDRDTERARESSWFRKLCKTTYVWPTCQTHCALRSLWFLL